MSQIEICHIGISPVKHDKGCLWGDSARLVMPHVGVSYVTHKDESSHA